MPPPASRVALYWTPDRDDPLWTAGNAWLGRDPELGVPVPQPTVPGLAALTAAPRLYGFHATLRPPIRLATGWEDFIGAATDLADRTDDFAMPPLAVHVVGRCLALCAAAPCPALHDLASDCVRATDPHRLRPDAAELARRRRPGLSPEEDALLLRWGYPYVMQRWQFHMTLTRQLEEAETNAIRPVAERHFASALSRSRRVGTIAVFTQIAADGSPLPFLMGERLTLRS